MDVEQIRAHYEEKVTGLDQPRWGRFDRDCVGVLLDALDAAEAERERLRTALRELVEMCEEAWPTRPGVRVARKELDRTD